MKQFTLKTYTPSAHVDMNCFYILNKGMNSGKPSAKPFVNCFTFVTDGPDERDLFYWITFAAWQARKFEPWLVGSVIPFIRIQDVNKIICEASKNCIAHPERVGDLLKNMHILNQVENKHTRLAKLTQQAKKAAALKFLNA